MGGYSGGSRGATTWVGTVEVAGELQHIAVVPSDTTNSHLMP